ncbi:hypothetical protein CGJ15_26505, partial [Vibrio parahaemolyticus]
CGNCSIYELLQQMGQQQQEWQQKCHSRCGSSSVAQVSVAVTDDTLTSGHLRTAIILSKAVTDAYRSFVVMEGFSCLHAGARAVSGNLSAHSSDVTLEGISGVEDDHE